jgi:hypothetical protein
MKTAMQVAAEILQLASDREWLAITEPVDQVRLIGEMIHGHVSEQVQEVARVRDQWCAEYVKVRNALSDAGWELEAARQRQEETERRDG